MTVAPQGRVFPKVAARVSFGAHTQIILAKTPHVKYSGQIINPYKAFSPPERRCLWRSRRLLPGPWLRTCRRSAATRPRGDGIEVRFGNIQFCVGSMRGTTIQRHISFRYILGRRRRAIRLWGGCGVVLGPVKRLLTLPCLPCLPWLGSTRMRWRGDDCPCVHKRLYCRAFNLLILHRNESSLPGSLMDTVR